ncbi:hypothetical protein ACFYSX_19615 [Kitasatospora sp. NPDC004622]
MLSVLAELQRELIVANTRDGLAAARARGRVGGRRPQASSSPGPTVRIRRCERTKRSSTFWVECRSPLPVPTARTRPRGRWRT